MKNFFHWKENLFRNKLLLGKNFCPKKILFFFLSGKHFVGGKENFCQKNFFEKKLLEIKNFCQKYFLSERETLPEKKLSNKIVMDFGADCVSTN